MAKCLDRISLSSLNENHNQTYKYYYLIFPITFFGKCQRQLILCNYIIIVNNRHNNNNYNQMITKFEELLCLVIGN